jgi:geranylgeranyl diphosphate synthase, type I
MGGHDDTPKPLRGTGCDTERVEIERLRRDQLGLARRVDDVLFGFLADVRGELATIDAGPVVLVEEIERLLRAGGKRLRPAFCYWGYRAAGGGDGGGGGGGEPIVRAAASLELLHTMALIHDDLMDGARERRGVLATASALERAAGPSAPPGYGRSAAILAGDLAAVLADRLLLDSGFGPTRVAAALERYHWMRERMAAGQFLDIAGLAQDEATARRAAGLKGGVYTVEGPLRIGAALAGASPEIEAVLVAFGAPLGVAFQLRDDLEDRDGRHGAGPEEIHALIARATAALDGGPVAADALDALTAMAEGLEAG